MPPTPRSPTTSLPLRTHRQTDTTHEAVPGIQRLLDAWRPINAAVNAIAESLGAPPLYPFDPTGDVLGKLAFVHQQVTAHTNRSSFYARL